MPDTTTLMPRSNLHKRRKRTIAEGAKGGQHGSVVRNTELPIVRR
jgi:hypothetical protein